ncbi:MAG: IS5/IS1182 family transposase, partial [Ghiorsea sp.]
MSHQCSFSGLEYGQKKRITRREKFLNEMELIVPWIKLIALIEPFYPKSGKRGRQPKGLEIMFRI